MPGGPGGGLVLRPARAKDAPAAADLIAASIRKLCTADHHDDPAIIGRWLADKTAEGLRRLMSAEGTSFLLAERDGGLVAVGALTLRDQPAETGKIELNYVLPAARFTGASRALLAGMERELCRRGVRHGRLTSTATAADFYRAAGWQPVGPPHQGRWIVGQRMEKVLGTAP